MRTYYLFTISIISSAAWLVSPAGCSSDTPPSRDQAAGSGGTMQGGAGTSSPISDSGSTTGAGGSGGGVSSGPDTPESVCREALAAQCQRRADCGTGNSLLCFGFTNLCPEYYFGPGSKRTVEGIRACITKLRELPCTEMQVGALPDCLIGGERAASMGCAYGSQCESASCSGGSQQCGTCARIAKMGESCTSGGSYGCEVSAFCHPTLSHCDLVSSIVHGAEGSKCDTSTSPVLGCTGDLVCLTTGGNAYGPGTCTKLVSEGSPCTGLGGLRCVPGSVCARTADGGGVCQSLTSCGGTPCDAMSYCNHQTDPGKCVPRAQEGKPCSMSGDTGTILCVPGTECTPIGTGGSQGVCLKEGTARSIACSDAQPSCPYPLKCVSDHCGPLDPTTCN